MPSFGQVLAEARRKTGLSQSALAALVVKADGSQISQAYLNDLEHDRRNPPSDSLIEQLASTLDLSPDSLFYSAGRLPPDIRDLELTEKQIDRAFKAFRSTLNRR